MSELSKLQNHLRDINYALDTFFDDPKWKDNITDHFKRLGTLRKKSAMLLRIEEEVGPSRYKPGKLTFGIKHIQFFKDYGVTSWKKFKNDPRTKNMLALVREELKYSEATADRDVLYGVYNELRKKSQI